MTIPLLSIFMAALGIAFYVLGYNRGVKHTEERWSDAVGRAAASTERLGR